MNAKPEKYKQIEKMTLCVTALLAFFSGVAIYACFRNINNMLLWQFLPKPKLQDLELIHINTNSIWLYLFSYNLPNGLWCLSGLLLIRASWLTNKKYEISYRVIWISATAIFEIMQLVEIIPGTFDLLDLASIGIFAFLESIIFTMFVKRRILL